jgi:hypothetical protein
VKYRENTLGEILGNACQLLLIWVHVAGQRAAACTHAWWASRAAQAAAGVASLWASRAAQAAAGVASPSLYGRRAAQPQPGASGARGRLRCLRVPQVPEGAASMHIGRASSYTSSAEACGEKAVCRVPSTGSCMPSRLLSPKGMRACRQRSPAKRKHRKK